MQSFAHKPNKVLNYQIWLPILLAAGLLGGGRIAPVQAQAVEVCPGVHQDVATPLTDLGASPYVRMDGQASQFTGGLYPQGSNQPPVQHAAAGLAAAARITPLDADGLPDAQAGKIVWISVGMSNTSYEFDRFISLLTRNPDINSRLLLVNGAQGGRTAERWVDPQAETWTEVNLYLERLGVTPLQVQVAWVKQTLTRGGDFPAKAQELQSNLEDIARNLKTHYPNLQIAYFSSRTRSYTYWRGLSPEPLAYETGFAVKWLVEKQINGDPGLNYDPAKGEVKAPILFWGPYLWADGANPRSDGLVWTAADMTSDCTHPSEIGADKVASQLLDFFTREGTAANWFLAGGAPAASQVHPTAVPPSPAAPPSSTLENLPLPETPAPAAPTSPGTSALLPATQSPTPGVQAQPAIPAQSSTGWIAAGLGLGVAALGLMGLSLWSKRRH